MRIASAEVSARTPCTNSHCADVCAAILDADGGAIFHIKEDANASVLRSEIAVAGVLNVDRIGNASRAGIANTQIVGCRQPGAGRAVAAPLPRGLPA